MKQYPKNLLYKKSYLKKTLSGRKGSCLSCFTVGLQYKSNCYLTYKQLESARRVILRVLRPKKKHNKKHARNVQVKNTKKRKRRFRLNSLIIRSNLIYPITKKPLQVRMGKGKGNPDHYVSVIKSAHPIMEMSRKVYKFQITRKVLTLASRKLPGRKKLIYTKNTRENWNNYKLQSYFKGY
jgi:ribosomal protein L16/L10AE